jgi:hypothetical protein
MHRRIQDDADDAWARGDGLLDVTDDVPTDRITDTTIQAVNGWRFSDSNTRIERVIRPGLDQDGQAMIVYGWRTSIPHQPSSQRFYNDSLTERETLDQWTGWA